MKTLLIGNFSYGTLESSYCNAFKKMGCEVNQFDLIREYKTISPFAGNRYTSRIFEGLFCSILNKKLLEYVKLQKPELIFIVKGSYVSPDTLKEIRKINKGLLVNFNPDNPFNLNPGASNSFIRESIPLYDCYFTWGKFLIPQLKNAGAQNVEYLPFAYDPEFHFPVEVSDEERNIYGSDIAFIGSWDEEREGWLEKLIDYDVAIWGNAWEKLKRNSPLKRGKWKKTEVLGKEFSKVCSASRIILNLVRKQNGNAHNMRTFEVPACRGFILTTRTEEQCQLFEEGKDIACFETISELKSMLDHYLSNETVRKQVSSSAYNKVQSHTYSERAKQILEVCLKRNVSVT